MNENFIKGVEIYLKRKKEKKIKRNEVLNSIFIGTLVGLTAFNLANLANIGGSN